MTLEVPCSPLFAALMTCDKPVVVFEGSSRSTKTYSIVQYLIYRALKEPGLTIRSYRNDQTDCRKTVMADFLDIMSRHFEAIYKPTSFKTQQGLYVFDNGSKYYFDGCDSRKLHGLKQDIAHLNEVMEISYDAWSQVAQRTRLQVLMDFNPSLSQHWVFSSVLSDPDKVFYRHSTYRLNKFLTNEQIYHIEKWEDTPDNQARKTVDKWHWEVYGLGKRARMPGTVYTRWAITEDYPERMSCQRWGYGLDFGFAVDPTALVECALFQDGIYLREIVYETGLVVGKSHSNPGFHSLEGRLEEHEIAKTAKIYADCAQPESIQVLRNAGYNVIPCRKGPDTVVSGIDRMQGYQMFVHIGSQNLQRELENYTWKKDVKTGLFVRQPVDIFNHGPDAFRYWGMEELPDAHVKRRVRRQQASAGYDPFAVF